MSINHNLTQLSTGLISQDDEINESQPLEEWQAPHNLSLFPPWQQRRICHGFPNSINDVFLGVPNSIRASLVLHGLRTWSRALLMHFMDWRRERVSRNLLNFISKSSMTRPWLVHNYALQSLFIGYCWELLHTSLWYISGEILVTTSVLSWMCALSVWGGTSGVDWVVRCVVIVFSKWNMTGVIRLWCQRHRVELHRNQDCYWMKLMVTFQIIVRLDR